VVDLDRINPDNDFTLHEAATIVLQAGLVSVSREQLRRAITGGKLFARRTPHGWIVRGSDLISWSQSYLLQHPPIPPGFLTAGQAAGRAGLNPHAALRAIAAGTLPARRHGNRWIVAIDDVDKWRANRRSGSQSLTNTVPEINGTS
jgi:hypothetical protein